MKIKESVNKGLEYFLIGLMSLMVLNVLWQVISRYALAKPSPFTDELARYLMIWLSLLGVAYVSGKRDHVSIDIIVRHTSLKTQKRLKVVACVCIILFCMNAMIIGGGWLVYTTFELKQLSPSLGLPLAYVYAVIPISGCLIIYNKALEIIE